MKDENGESMSVDLEEVRRDFDEYKDVISLIFSVEAMTTPTRSEFDRLPAKYIAIALTIGADKVSREIESQNNLLRFFGGT